MYHDPCAEIDTVWSDGRVPTTLHRHASENGHEVEAYAKTDDDNPNYPERDAEAMNGEYTTV